MTEFLDLIDDNLEYSISTETFLLPTLQINESKRSIFQSTLVNQCYRRLLTHEMDTKKVNENIREAVPILVNGNRNGLSFDLIAYTLKKEFETAMKHFQFKKHERQLQPLFYFFKYDFKLDEEEDTIMEIRPIGGILLPGLFNYNDSEKV